MTRTLIIETIKKINQRVLLKGWVHLCRDKGKIIFIELRDRTGVVQAVVLPENKEVFKTAKNLNFEDVVELTGRVNQRPEKQVNKESPCGAVEIQTEQIKILNKSAVLPFEISKDEFKDKTKEELRLKYRYLDLRREKMKKNLILRHQVIKFIRDWLTKKDFLEVETPILTKSTPEGARDYVVPSRLEKGKFYALPQSPQQYKQLLMVAGLERYFQIARCFRDEDTRGDRQPEFTQLDLEMSFVEQEDILQLIEGLIINLVQKITPEKYIIKTPFPRLKYSEAMAKYQTDKPDLRKDKNDPDELAFCFIVDFPMFEWKEEEKRWDAVHHPFTKPQTDDLIFLKEQPAKILAYQYDLILNGYEIGGGSLREHQPAILQAVFEVMGHQPQQIKEKFGHLLEAFQYGAPPHGGIAIGLDRLIMILANEPSIREVIAFPKTSDGKDLMTDAPTRIEKEQLNELGLKNIN